MKTFFRLAFTLLGALILAACTNLPINTPELPAPTATPENLTSETPQASAEETPAETGPQTLRIWLPPQFDPYAETEAGAILRSRLETFEKRRPDLILDIRIKAVNGPAGLLEALITTQKAAPSLQPDLIALSRPDLEQAALEGILHPIDGLSVLLDDPDWFPYARALARIQNSTFGLPFSADLFGLVYRPNTKIEDAPALPTIESLLAQETQIIFPADNAQAEMSFCQYTATGITLRDEQGLPSLSADELNSLLTFYASESISPKSSEIEDVDTLWEIFNLYPETAATVWASDYFARMPADTEIVPIPGLNEDGCALASAWSWALAGSSPDIEPAAVELAEYLSDSQFLAEWTLALGSLPPRPTALDENATALQALSLAAQPIPSNDIVAFLGEKFRTATMSVLRDQVTPSAAAEEALTGLQ